MVTLSVCIEMFWPGLDPVEKIRRVGRTDVKAYEFWTHSNKDIPAMAAAQAEAGLRCAGLVLEPHFSLVTRGVDKEFLAGTRQSASVARQLGAPGLILTTGNVLADESWEATFRRARRRLRTLSAICADEGLKIFLEPLNPIKDHKGYWLTTMAQAADLVAEVDSPALTILYDLYHQQLTEGNLLDNLRQYLPVVGHIHTAGAPERHELVGGENDYGVLFAEIDRLGYDGFVGLEFRPTLSDEDAIAQAFELARANPGS